MLVVGGSYHERCENPRSSTLAGSGLRAAASLTKATDVRLVTSWSEHEDLVARATAGALGVTCETLPRTEPVRFSYFSPLAAPSINGQAARLQDPHALEGLEDDNALVFGMLEAGADVTVRCRRAVLDPQKPRDLAHADMPTVQADELVLVLNSAELRQLGRNDPDLLRAARTVLAERGATAVVVKRGPRGAVVVTARVHETVPPFETSRVYPVGSGDVFAAGFARAWTEQGADPVEAARAGSAAAAVWCETQDYEAVLLGPGRRRPVPVVDDILVYLAGPFFTLAERWLVDVVRSALSPAVWSPFHEVGPGGVEVAEKDLAGLRQCSSVLALLDGGDAGTLFEAGYATLMGLPVVTYAENADAEAYKMLVGTGADVHSDLSTSVYRAVWAAMRHAAETRPAAGA
jgi:hypothetical protein